MERAPASHLVDGLRQLVNDLAESPQPSGGLDGVACGATDLIGFYADRIEYCGMCVDFLCDEGSFEAVMWLLLNDDYPCSERLADCFTLLNESAVIDQPIADMIAAVPLQTRPLDLFPVSVSLLSCFDPTPCDRTLAASRSQFWRVMAQVPVLMHVAFGGDLENGRAFHEDARNLSWAGRLLQILRDDGEVPTPVEEQAMNTLMICQCLTEMRPACFLMRLFGSTVNDVVAGLKAASSMYVSQLRNDPYAWTASQLRQLSSPVEAEEWWRNRGGRMPFGFVPATDELDAVDAFPAPDPRVRILRQRCRELLGSVDSLVLESSASRLELLMKQEGYVPTMDWAAARLLALLNVPEDRMALAIGMARMAGWAAQAVEQHDSGLPLLPRLRYPGED